MRWKEYFLAILTASLGACAQPGYHYDVGGFTQIPNDPCWRQEMKSPGAISLVNASVGHPDGVPSKVSSISDLTSPDYVQLSGVGIRLNSSASSISCHVTLNFTDGTDGSGLLSIDNPGAYATIQVAWIPDEAIAERLAASDHLRTSKNLLVSPDLKNPAIQRCVGRQTALGASEEFAGQLWIACADKLGLLQSKGKN